MARKKQKKWFTRPVNPLTDKVVEDIEIKLNILMGKFKDFANGERREYRRNDIYTRLVGAVMKAHKKFRDNDRCSFDTYADIFIVSEVKHYVRDNARVIEEERVTVSCDRRVDDDDGDASSFVAGMEDPRDRFAEGILKFDFDVITEMLAKQNPVYATIFSLRREGYKLCEIHPLLGVPDWELYDILWPAVKDAVRRIYDHGC